LFVVVGLGNPGRAYAQTRHNIGFNTIDILAKRNNIKINKIKFKSVYGEGSIGGERVFLVKPQTYMNNSGLAVRDICNFYKIDMENLIILVDDIDIDFAAVRIRRKGSAGSHNGLKSIIYQLQRDDFPRVKIGIGKKGDYEDLADFVLSKFRKEEQEIIEASLLTGAEAVETIIEKGIDNAMNQFNIKANGAQE